MIETYDLQDIYEATLINSNEATLKSYEANLMHSIEATLINSYEATYRSIIINKGLNQILYHQL